MTPTMGSLKAVRRLAETPPTGYTHGPPASRPDGPQRLMTPGQAPAGSSGMKLTGSRMSCGISTADATDDDAWTDWEMAMSGERGRRLGHRMDPGEYTFMRCRGLGATMPGLVTCTVRQVQAPRAMTVPVPTPTLPEIAALFLAMLLLGSGAYLLRRRQSGGLTPA